MGLSVTKTLQNDESATFDALLYSLISQNAFLLKYCLSTPTKTEIRSLLLEDAV